MRRLAALALFLIAAPLAAQTPAPPASGDSLRFDEDWLEGMRERLDGVRERLAERLRDTTVAVRGRCDAGAPMPTPYGPGGAPPAPMPRLQPGAPVPMPNLCGDVAVARRVPGAPAVVTPYRFGPPARPDGLRRFAPRGPRLAPEFFPPPAPPPGER